MGRLQKKGRKGAVTNYVSRSQALRRLQIKLPDFRLGFFFPPPAF